MLTATPRVLVVGGGIAGLEALLGLRRHLGSDVSITLLDPAPDFVLAPLTVGQPFAVAHPIRVPLRRVAADLGIDLVAGRATRIDLARREVRTDVGRALPYDALLVTVGARPEAPYPRVTTWWPGGDPEHYGGLLRDLEEGYSRRVAFLVPPGPAWPLPAYELALLTAQDVAGMDIDADFTFITPELEPLAAFGPQSGRAVRDALHQAGVGIRTGVQAEVHHDLTTTVSLHPTGDVLEVDRVISIPRLTGPRLPGLPADAEGFVLVDADQRIAGSDAAWAAGDGTSAAIKFGGLATHQARRALSGIAALVGGHAPDEPDAPALEGVLMTGRGVGVGVGASPAGGPAPFWTPDRKVGGTYLSAYLRGLDQDGDPTPPAAALAGGDRRPGTRWA